MKNFVEYNLYTRKQVWNHFHPNESFVKGGPWATGYLTEGNHLIAFANINSPGRTGHDFPNKFDENNSLMTWYGKPNAHSEQPTFRSLFQGKLKLLMFVRWDNKNALFTYLGSPKIDNFENDIVLLDGTRTIRLNLSFTDEFSFHEPPKTGEIFTEGRIIQLNSKRFERSLKLRSQCINYHGTDCKICGFDFESVFGDLGANFCHVHHITPLSEVGMQHEVCPKKDLIPVCPNCHAMLHRRVPALQPTELREMLIAQKNQNPGN